MARITKKMTPEQFRVFLLRVNARLSDITPVTRKLAKRYQTAIRRNVRSGKNADRTPMAPLKAVTLQATTRDSRERNLGQRSSFGDKPLILTGKTVKNLKGLPFKRGFVIAITDAEKQKFANMQANRPSGETLRIRVTRKMSRHLASAHNIGARIGSVLIRVARQPYALSGRQVKRSVTDLNKHVIIQVLAGF